MKAFNFYTLVEYSGRNAGLVGNGEINAFATFLQLKKMGYSVNKGAHGVSIFTGYRTKEKTDGTTETVPTHAFVFDIADTNATQDEKFMTWLKTEAVKNIQPSAQEVGEIVMAGVLA